MLRRTKSQEVDGHAMLDIPPLTFNKVEVEFSVEERDLYESLFKSSITRYDKFVSSGKVAASFSSLFSPFSFFIMYYY